MTLKTFDCPVFLFVCSKVVTVLFSSWETLQLFSLAIQFHCFLAVENYVTSKLCAQLGLFGEVFHECFHG